jgi:formate C-acetyltransferase
LGLNSIPARFDDFEALYDKFKADLQKTVEEIYNKVVLEKTGQVPGLDWNWSLKLPCSVASLFTEGCLETGLSYLGGGSRYTVVSPHIGGAPDVGNSLYAIKKLVFEDKKVSFGELMVILQKNWEGYEPLRQYVMNKYTYYGNDQDEADSYTSRVLNDFADIVEKLNGRCPVLFPAGVSTFGRQIEWAPYRAALPSGQKKGEVLSGNASPAPGTDTAGATAIIKSYCKADLSRQACGAALDVKLYPATVQRENGITALVALLQGFVRLGGFFMQLDVMDAEILRQAREHPEDFKTLSVRVSGWNARFVTLNKEW